MPHQGPLRRRGLSWIAVLAAACPASAWAQYHGSPYADAAYEYDSNLFALAAVVAAPLGNSGPTKADSVLRTRVGLEATYDWSLQELYANVEGRRFDYDHFSVLDHDEYLLNGGLKWKLASLLDGTLDYRRERTMVSFLDYNATQASLTTPFIQNQTLGTASVNIQVTPDWRLESTGQINELDSPRPGLLDLSLREESINEGLRYVGISKLSAGVNVIYLSGHFTGADFVGTPRYAQSTAELAAKYVATGLSSFDGALGYTRRTQQRDTNLSAAAVLLEQPGSVSGTTGLLAYERALTGKTSIGVKLSRAINSYVTYGGTEVDTGAIVEAIWNTTQRIAVTPSYQWTYSVFPSAVQSLQGAVPVGFGISERIDHYQLARLTVKYRVLNWLSLRPYAQYETRGSNIAINEFNRTLYGIEFEARLGQNPNQNQELVQFAPYY
jgi:hypothetical protein